MAKKSRSTPKIDRNSPEFKARVKSRYKNKIKKNFAERMLGAYGFGEENFREGGIAKGKLGLFGGAMKAQGKKQYEEETVTTSPERPRTERRRYNPSITTIIDQLNVLIKIAEKIGAISEQQRQQFEQELSQANRDSKEASMERGSGNPYTTNMSGTNFSSLNEELGTLIKESLKPFKKIVDEKVEEEEKSKPKSFMQRFAEEYGLGDIYEDRQKRAKIRSERIKTKPGYKRILGSNGRVTYRGPNGRIVSPSEAIAQRSSKLERILSAPKNVGKSIIGHFQKAPGVLSRGIASRVGGSKIFSKVTGATKNIASLVGKSFKSAGVATEAAEAVGPSLIRRVAGPIIKGALGGTIIKSIPILGTAVGGLFAAKKLVEGDPVGAGLEAASGLAGPFSAMAALIASAARDTYSSIFKVQPEQDPHFLSRMAMITGVITAMATALLAPKITKEKTPSATDVDKATIPPSMPTKASGEGPTGQPKIPPAPTPSTTETPKSTASSGGGSSSGSSSNKSSGGTKVRKGGKAPNVPSDYSDQFKKSFNSEFMKSIAETPSMVSSPSSAADTAKKTAEAESAANQPSLIDLRTKRPLPSNMPPSKSGVSGAGNVPDPNYYGMGEVFNQIYFNPNPVASA